MTGPRGHPDRIIATSEGPHPPVPNEEGTATLARITTAAGVRPAERPVMVLVAAAFATIEAGRGIGEVGANTLVLGRIGAEALPYLFLPLGVISLVAALGYGAALGRMRRGRLFSAILVAVAIALIAERAAIATVPELAIPLTWLTVIAAGAIAVTLAWTVATSTFDARQAKRLFPLCTAAAIAGNFVGALAAGPVAGLVGTESLIVAEAALLTIGAIVIWRLASLAPTPAWGAPPSVRRPIVADLRAGFDEVRRAPLLGLIAVAYVLLAVLLFSVTFPFLEAAEAAFPDEVELAAAIGTISAIVTAASFVVSLALAGRFYARFGVASAALLLPLVYLAGFGVWIVSFTFTTAALVMATVQVTQRGLSNAAWSAFYNTVPAHRRAQVMAFQDGVPGQVGTILSGVLLLTAARVVEPSRVFWLGASVAAVTLLITIGIRRRYAASLLATLRRGIGEQVLEGGPGLAGLETAPDVRAVLLTALADADSRVREMAAKLLAAAPGDDTLDGLLAALDDPEPAVRASSAEALIGKDAVHPEHIERAEAEIDRLLAGGSRERTAALDALARLGRRPPEVAIERLVHDASAEVRAAAISTLGVETGGTDRLLAALDDPTYLVRNAAADRLSAATVMPSGVIDRLESPDPAVQASAVRAMTGHATEIRDALVGWADRQVDRAMSLATSRSRLAEVGVPGPDASFLAAVLDQRRRRHQDLALDALAILDVPEASGVIRRCLRSDDADVRAQAIETLDSVGDRRLGRSIARLVELDPAASPLEPRDDVLDALRHDDDPWIRTLAARSAGDGGDMAGPDTSLGEIERMLELRRVPLFERLSPEDLQRVASVAEERDFTPGAPLMTEGDVGNELFVILEGRVRVQRVEPDGSIRQIRTYEQGDHVGELAVLLDRARVATVVADGEVRTLVIDGEGLRSILRERPEAAMAMLQTLAERISRQ
ncbi:MAG TPA: HEAT repeat domain-containing protein [Candidatus Limnocylindrales bacterium]